MVIVVKEEKIKEEEFPELNNIPLGLKECHDFFTKTQDELPRYELEPSMFRTIATDPVQKARTNGLR